MKAGDVITVTTEDGRNFRLIVADPAPTVSPWPIERLAHYPDVLGIEDRTADCPCRPENGGSGICGCTLGGPPIT